MCTVLLAHRAELRRRVGRASANHAPPRPGCNLYSEEYQLHRRLRQLLATSAIDLPRTGLAGLTV